MRATPLRLLPPTAALLLVACSDGSIRSPDLPPVQLTGIGPVVCSYPGGGTSIGGNFGSLHNQVFKPTVSCE